LLQADRGELDKSATKNEDERSGLSHEAYVARWERDASHPQPAWQPSAPASPGSRWRPS
jgi:hypothetical protein